MKNKNKNKPLSNQENRKEVDRVAQRLASKFCWSVADGKKTFLEQVGLSGEEMEKRYNIAHDPMMKMFEGWYEKLDKFKKK